jgi:hypothetical protein
VTFRINWGVADGGKDFRTILEPPRRLAAFGKRTHLPGTMLDLTQEETDALARLLRRTIDDDRYPLSPHIQTLKAVLDQIRPGPVREPLPSLKVYAPPRATAARRRRRG